MWTVACRCSMASATSNERGSTPALAGWLSTYQNRAALTLGNAAEVLRTFQLGHLEHNGLRCSHIVTSAGMFCAWPDRQAKSNLPI
jgi:hypothetical protein